MQLQNRFASLHIRRIDHDLAIKPARAKQRAVEHLGPVRCRQHDHAHVGLESIHAHQQLIQGLFPFVVHHAHLHAALAADGIEFVDEDDAGGLCLGLLEQVAHARRAHADEHFHELAAADREERHMGFAGHGAGQQRLARARRPDQQHPLGNLRPQRPVALRSS